jgi:hypothetical protein
VTRRFALLFSLAIAFAVLLFGVPLAPASAQKSGEAEVVGRILVVTSSFNSSAPAPAHAIRLIVGDDEVITVTLAPNIEMTDAAGRPRTPSDLRAGDVVRIGGVWEAPDRFLAHWLVWAT